MDWPVIGSLTGVAVLAAMLGAGTLVALRSDEPSVKAPPRAPALLAFAPSRTPGDAAARPPQLAAPALSLSLLSVQDAQQHATASVPRLNAQPDPERLGGPRQRPFTASVPAEESPKPDRPAIVAKLAPKEANDTRRKNQDDGRVMTAAKIARLRMTLRLLPDQVEHWRPVEAILREIGREQIAQIRRGATPEVGTGVMMRLYYAAQPLLGTLQPDQKDRVRSLARSLGYGSVASML